MSLRSSSARRGAAPPQLAVCSSRPMVPGAPLVSTTCVGAHDGGEDLAWGRAFRRDVNVAWMIGELWPSLPTMAIGTSVAFPVINPGRRRPGRGQEGGLASQRAATCCEATCQLRKRGVMRRSCARHSPLGSFDAIACVLRNVGSRGNRCVNARSVNPVCRFGSSHSVFMRWYGGVLSSCMFLTISSTEWSASLA